MERGEAGAGKLPRALGEGRLLLASGPLMLGPMGRAPLDGQAGGRRARARGSASQRVATHTLELMSRAARSERLNAADRQFGLHKLTVASSSPCAHKAPRVATLSPTVVKSSAERHFERQTKRKRRPASTRSAANRARSFESDRFFTGNCMHKRATPTSELAGATHPLPKSSNRPRVVELATCEVAMRAGDGRTYMRSAG